MLVLASAGHVVVIIALCVMAAALLAWRFIHQSRR